MSLWRDELKPAPGTIACLIALGIVSIASLGQVIVTPDYLGYAIAGSVVGAAFALYFGQRSLGIGFALLLMAALLALPVMFVRGPDASVLPTPSALTAARDLIAEGFGAIPKVTPPVPAEPRFTILIWLATLLLGFLSAAWVVVRRPVGAVVSMLAIVTFSGSVGDGDARMMIAVAAVACTAAFFLSEGRHRIARWGGGRIAIPAWLGLPTLVAACIVALVAPTLLGDKPILKLQSAIRPRVVIIKPLSDIRRQLKVDPPLEVLRVVSPRATYWRLTGLDAYDGQEWVLEARPRRISDGEVPKADPPTTGEVLEQQYRLTHLLAPWLPAAYAAEFVEADAQVEVDGGSQTLLLGDGSSPGLSYTVRSRLPRVTENLVADPRDVDDPRAVQFGAQARQLVGDARTPLDIARRLEEHFHTYTYDEDVEGGHTVERLQTFLAERKGYCEQFAATMTLMLRGLGIDARVGVGFLPGAFRDGEYVVSTRDAHAWVEVNLPGVGWYSFDPTPGRADAASLPESNEELPEPEEIPPQVTAPPQPTPAPDEFPQEVTDPSLADRIPEGVLYAMLAAIALAAPPTAKAVRRGRRRRGTPDEAVIGAYTELIDSARDLGWRPRDAETVREFTERALRGDESGTSLAWLAARALYAPGRSEPADANTAWSALEGSRAKLRAASPWWRRLIAAFDPRTFVPEQVRDRVRGRVAAAFGRA